MGSIKWLTSTPFLVTTESLVGLKNLVERILNINYIFKNSKTVRCCFSAQNTKPFIIHVSLISVVWVI